MKNTEYTYVNAKCEELGTGQWLVHMFHVIHVCLHVFCEVYIWTKFVSVNFRNKLFAKLNSPNSNIHTNYEIGKL